MFTHHASRITAAVAILWMILLSSSGRAATIITANVSITNTATGTTNGQTLTINASVRTFTNSVVTSATQILTNSTAAGTATNIFNQVGLNPVSGIDRPVLASPTNVTMRSGPGFALTVTLSAGIGLVTYTTNATGTADVLRIPNTVESAASRTNLASGTAAWVNDPASTNTLSQVAPAMAEMMGKTNDQTITGRKTFTAPILDNATNTGFTQVAALTGDSISANRIVLGNVGSGIYIESPGAFPSGYTNQMISFSGNYYYYSGAMFASGAGTLKWGTVLNGSLASTVGTLYFANGIPLADTNGAAFLTNSGSFFTGTHAGSFTGTQSAVVMGGTNAFPAGSDISFGRYANTSLANGVNAAVLVGTNVFMEVSGPSAAFTINGIFAGGSTRDGKEILIYNGTGFDMTVANQSGGDPTAANRIITMTGADRTTTGNGFVRLIYSAGASRWIEESFNP